MKKRKLGIYIHIPFCVRKCLYCDFPSAPADRQEQGYYMRQLMKEIRSFEPLGNLYEIKSVFFGGGTPSILPPDQIRRVLGRLCNQFLFEDDAEITIECNPGTLTREKLAAYRECGINRLSIGLQSADNAMLKLLGRIHTWEDFLESWKLAREAGFTNINIDLMSGLPGQTFGGWSDTLEKVAALEPEHISAYSLIVEEGTPFYERYGTAEGQRLLPDEVADRDMYHHTGKFLAEQGYHRYEISNYAKDGYECEHNKIYWTCGDYLGFGLSAASYVDGRRFQNPVDPKEYYAHIGEGYRMFRQMPAQSEKDAIEEYMFLGLRMMRGVSVAEFEARFGRDYRSLYGKQTDELIRRKLLQVQDGRICLTERGIDISNTVLANFIFD